MRKAIRNLCGMICLVAIVAFAVAAFGSLQTGWREAGWYENYELALEESRRSNRPVLVYFDAIWCSWCQQYKREVLDKPQVKLFIHRYYSPVVVDFDARPDLFNHFGGRGLPFTVFLSPDGNVVNRFVGILSVKDFFKR